MSQDIAVLAAAITTTLAPALPYLVKAGEGAATELGKQLPAALRDKASAIWKLLRPAAEASPGFPATVAALEADSSDPDALGALRLQLRGLLADDPALAAQLRPLIQAGDTSTNITNIGNDNIIAGRDITGNVINRPPR
ncbi:MAG: hypothetical protein AB7P40_31800 [Chloroflexota bacterium]